MKNTVILESDSTEPSFFGFDVMITPMLMKAVFVLGLMACLTLGGILVVRDQAYVAGFCLAIFGPIALRVWCELTMVRFKMLEYLRNAAR